MEGRGDPEKERNNPETKIIAFLNILITKSIFGRSVPLSDATPQPVLGIIRNVGT